MPEPPRIQYSQLSPEQRRTLAWFSEHFEPHPDPKTFAELVDMGLMMGNRGTLCRTIEGQRVYEESISAERREVP